LGICEELWETSCILLFAVCGNFVLVIMITVVEMGGFAELYHS